LPALSARALCSNLALITKSSALGGADDIFSWLVANNRRFPDKVFIESIDQGKSISHGAMFRLSRQIAHYLRARGFKANDRVALLAGNSIEHLAVYFGVLAYGATICTINVERISLSHGAQQRRHHPRRRQYLSGRDRQYCA